MSVERRIREGLVANTAHLPPAPERDLEVVMKKIERRRHNRRVRYGGTGLVAAAAAVAGIAWLTGAVDSDPVSEPAAPLTEPTASSAGAPELPTSGRVEPGRYEARFAGGGPASPRAVVDVPSGFAAWGGVAVLEPDGPGGVGFWTAARVKPDPCDPSTLGHDPGPTVEDLATALVDQKRTTATRPVPTSVDGRDGLYLELTMPGVDVLKKCGSGQFQLWSLAAGGTRYVDVADVVLRLWLLEVDGERLVINATDPAPSPAGARQVQRMIDSVRFVDPES